MPSRSSNKSSKDDRGRKARAQAAIKGHIERMVDRLVNKWSPKKCQSFFDEGDILELCYRSREVIWQQPIIVDVTAPVNVCGDIHGQFQNLVTLFKHIGFPPQQKYVFLGDYVDRGPFSLEVMMLLLSLKILYPEHIYLLRGNHESASVNVEYGFYQEVKNRYSQAVYDIFQHVFYLLPFCARIEGRVICMHGGISELLINFEQLIRIERPCDVPELGVLADLTWSDPDVNIDDYGDSQRGAGHIFGVNAVNDFCKNLDVDLIVRAHQVVPVGYEFFADRRLLTLFSAPKYGGVYNNAGAVLHIKRDEMKLTCSFTIFRPSTTVYPPESAE